MTKEDTGVKPETNPDEKALDSEKQPSNPIQDNAGQDEVARLRKEREQLEMERNMLRNKLEAEEQAKAKAKEAELKEQERFKELYEKERQEREKLENDVATREEQANILQAKTTALADFPDDVKEIAEELGYELSAADDSTVEAYKAKLSNIQKKLSDKQVVSPNNPGEPKKAPLPTGDELKIALKSPQSFDELIDAKFPGIAAMKTPQK